MRARREDAPGRCPPTHPGGAAGLTRRRGDLGRCTFDQLLELAEQADAGFGRRAVGGHVDDAALPADRPFAAHAAAPDLIAGMHGRFRATALATPWRYCQPISRPIVRRRPATSVLDSLGADQTSGIEGQACCCYL
jgi:hypothetical protein